MNFYEFLMQINPSFLSAYFRSDAEKRIAELDERIIIMGEENAVLLQELKKNQNLVEKGKNNNLFGFVLKILYLLKTST